MAIYLNPADCVGLKRDFFLAAAKREPASVKAWEASYLLETAEPGEDGWFVVLIVDSGTFDAALVVDTQAERRAQIAELANDARRCARIRGYLCKRDWIMRIAPEEGVLLG